MGALYTNISFWPLVQYILPVLQYYSTWAGLLYWLRGLSWFPVDSVELTVIRRTAVSPNVVAEAHLSTQRRERERNTDQRWERGRGTVSGMAQPPLTIDGLESIQSHT